MDTGSVRTLIGGQGLNLVQDLRLPISRDQGGRIKLADGQIAEIEETMEVSFRLSDVEHELPVGLAPQLAVPCIAGLDFLRTFRICIDADRSEWFFSKRPKRRYLFSVIEEADYVCSGLLELTLEQQARLEKFSY